LWFSLLRHLCAVRLEQDVLIFQTLHGKASVGMRSDAPQVLPALFERLLKVADRQDDPGDA